MPTNLKGHFIVVLLLWVSELSVVMTVYHDVTANVDSLTANVDVYMNTSDELAIGSSK